MIGQQEISPLFAPVIVTTNGLLQYKAINLSHLLSYQKRHGLCMNDRIGYHLKLIKKRQYEERQEKERELGRK
jgi:hypothetical protein